ncbi:TPA: DUF4376 domain-containing protein [Escherichia coli]|nr:DUF4376 domain-containing protein [Escherichia coli]
MMHVRNFSYYTPAEPDVAGAIYLKSEDGQDWYECQSRFAEDTLKVVYDSRGVITGYGKDIKLLWPVNQSVAEVPDTPESLKIDLSGRWGFDGEKITDLLTADRAREQKGAEINAWRSAMENAEYVFEYNGRKWDYGKVTQVRLEPSVAAAKAGILPEGFFWTDAENNDVPMTAEALLALSAAAEKAMFQKGMEIHVRQRNMKKELEKLTSADEILAYPVGRETK